MDISPHIPFQHKWPLWKQLNWQQMKLAAEVRTVGLGERYLQSGSVHVSRQFSSPSTGYHEHFIWVHLQRETRVSGHVTPAYWCELSVNTSFNKQIIETIKMKGISFSQQYCLWLREHWVGEQVCDREWRLFCRFGRGGGDAGCYIVHTFRWRHVQ